MEILPGLHQLQTPMENSPLKYVLTYVLEGLDGILLFDTGYGTPQAWDGLTRELKGIGYAPSDIQRVLISHGHPDHAGMVGWVRQQSPGVEVGMIAREWRWMSERHRQEEMSGEDGVTAWDRILDDWMVLQGLSRREVEQGRLDHRAEAPDTRGLSNVPVTQIPMVDRPELLLEDGDEIRFGGWSLQAVWTPGHTPGHLCLYEHNHRVMFTGDHVLPRITPNVSLHAGQEGTSPLADFRASLEKAAAFEVDITLPAHLHTIPDLRARCNELLDHHAQRLNEVEAAVRGRPRTARDVAASVHWNAGPFDEFPLRTKRSAVGETLAHLQVLMDEGRVRRDDDDRIVWEIAG